MLPANAYPKPTAQAPPYVTALGLEMAFDLLIAFGGAQITLSETARNSMVARFVGSEKAAAFYAAVPHPPADVTLANKWLAQFVRVRRLTKSSIARKLRVSESSVRLYLGDAPSPRANGRISSRDPSIST